MDLILIKVTCTQGFHWRAREGVFAKGVAYDGDLNMLDSAGLVEHFASVDSCVEFERKLLSLNGNFAVVIRHNKKLYAGVDRARSIPLFYGFKGEQCLVADNAQDIACELSADRICAESLAQFKVTGYTLGEQTLYEGVLGMEPGQYLIYDGFTLKKHYYYRYFQSSRRISDVQDLHQELESVSQSVFLRLIHSVGQRQLVVSLSGGYDSRYVVTMLAKLGCKNVLCYTYGTDSSYEVKTSEEVAKRLGYKWAYYEYNESTWCELFTDAETKHMLAIAHNGTSLPWIQDFAAVRHFTRIGVIEKDAIICTGFGGDALGGSYLPMEDRPPNGTHDFSELARYIAKKTALLSGDEKTNALYYDSVRRRLVAKSSRTDDSIITYESFLIEYALLRFIFNATRNYEFLGLEWRLPLWDNQLVDFWLTLPTHLRAGKLMYEEFLFTRLFDPLGVSFRKPKALTRTWLGRAVRLILPRQFFWRIRNLVKLGVFKHSQDINAFAPLCIYLARESQLSTSNLGDNINAVFCHWFLFHRYQFGLPPEQTTNNTRDGA